MTERRREVISSYLLRIVDAKMIGIHGMRRGNSGMDVDVLLFKLEDKLMNLADAWPGIAYCALHQLFLLRKVW